MEKKEKNIIADTICENAIEARDCSIIDKTQFYEELYVVTSDDYDITNEDDWYDVCDAVDERLTEQDSGFANNIAYYWDDEENRGSMVMDYGKYNLPEELIKLRNAAVDAYKQSRV